MNRNPHILKTWLIDDVLDVSSKFWKYNKYDLDEFFTRITPLRTNKLFRIDEQVVNDDPLLDHFSEFISFFQDLAPEEIQEYVDFLEDNESPMLSDHFWKLMDRQDRRELFNNDLDKFDKWYSTLHQSELDYYMGRIAGNIRLVPSTKVLEFVKKLNGLTGEKTRKIKSYPLTPGKYITVQLIGDKLAISSKDIKRLDSVKDLLLSRGNVFLEERYKVNPASGEKIYTYLFLTHKQL